MISLFLFKSFEIYGVKITKLLFKDVKVITKFSNRNIVTFNLSIYCFYSYNHFRYFWSLWGSSRSVKPTKYVPSSILRADMRLKFWGLVALRARDL